MSFSPQSTLGFLIAATAAAQAPSGWMRIDSTGEDSKRVPLESCSKLDEQTSKPPVDGFTDLKTDTSIVGSVGKMAVYSVLHNYVNNSGDAEFVRRIFVERAPGQFCEIYRLHGNPDVFFDPGESFIVDAGDIKIVSTAAYLKGNAHMRDEVSWIVDSTGAHELKLDPVWEAFRSTVPKGMSVLSPVGLNMERLCYYTQVWGPDDPACCGTAGSFFAKFKLQQGKLAVLQKAFDPKDSDMGKHFSECPPR